MAGSFESVFVSEAYQASVAGRQVRCGQTDEIRFSMDDSKGAVLSDLRNTPRFGA